MSLIRPPKRPLPVSLHLIEFFVLDRMLLISVKLKFAFLPHSNLWYHILFCVKCCCTRLSISYESQSFMSLPLAYRMEMPEVGS